MQNNRYVLDITSDGDEIGLLTVLSDEQGL